MTLDWNWFFSAFAQCSAALIGIIAAFVISKLIGENEKGEKIKMDLDNLIIDYNDLLRRIGTRYFDWHDIKTIEYNSKLEESIENGDFDGLTDTERLAKLFEIIPSLFGSNSCLEELDKRINEIKPTYTYHGNITVRDRRPLKMTPQNLWADIQQEREEANKLKIESESMIEKFVLIESLVISSIARIRPIKVVVVILMIGFIPTVTYPLHFMPLTTNQLPKISFDFCIILNHFFSLKGALLLILSIVIEGLLGYFLILINQISKNYQECLNKIGEEHKNLVKYCEYFK